MKILSLVILLWSSSIFAAEDSIYNFNWLDEDETVYVIQNKEYPTNGRVELNLSLTDSDHTPYQTSLAGTVGLTYYFTEVFSIDLMYKTYFNSNNNDFNLLDDLGAKPLMRIVDGSSFLHFNWLPFYGKINTLNKIFYFYWGVGAGVGTFNTRTNYETFKVKEVPVTYIKEDKFGFNTKTFVKFFLAENWNFGIEIDIYFFNATTDYNPTTKAETTGMVVFNDTSLNFGYLF